MQQTDNHDLSPKVLKGIKVVELGHYLSAPLVGMLLVDQGADVIHVVPPNPSSPDPILDIVLERGKIHFEIDLKTTEGKNNLLELLANADIVVENYAPGTFQKLGIDFEKIRKDLNSGLITCSIPAFSSGDPRSSIPGFEGIAAMAGVSYEKPLGKPVFHNFPVGSVMAALYSSSAIMAALIARHKTGQGQHIEVSLYGSNVFAQVLQALVLTGAPKSFMPLKMVGTPFMGVWECADGRYVYVHITLPTHNAEFWDHLQANGLDIDVREIRSVLSPQTIKDPSMIKNLNEADSIRQCMKKIFLKKAADEWERLAGDKFCVIKIRLFEEWIKDGMDANMTDCQIIKDPLVGDLYAPGPVIYSPPHHSALKPRQLTYTTDEITKRWTSGNKRERAKATNNALELKHPLEGFRIFDLSRIIAGPFAARILAEFGAEVISIQSPNLLDWAISFHVVFNVGKESITLDLTSDEGKRRLWALIKELKPNAVLQNFRNLELTKQIGIDYDKMREALPNIVYTYMNAYGIEGNWQHRPAFEQIVQAITGIQLSYIPKGKPKLFPMAILDTGAGLMGAFATLCGLYKQITTGEGLFVTTHMTTMATLLQIKEFRKIQEEKALKVAAEHGNILPINPLNDIYSGIFHAFDRFFMLTGRKGDLLVWCKKIKLIKDVNSPFETQIKRIRRIFAYRSLHYWTRSIQKHGFQEKIGIIRRHRVKKLVKESRKYDKNPLRLVQKKAYPGLGSLTIVRTPVRFSLTPIKDVAGAPIRGTHTKKYLSQIGIEVDEGEGIYGYPKEKPLAIWLWNFVVWGFYALKSGAI